MGREGGRYLIRKPVLESISPLPFTPSSTYSINSIIREGRGYLFNGENVKKLHSSSPPSFSPLGCHGYVKGEISVQKTGR